MTKPLTYFGMVVAGLAVIMIFLTAKNYSQLAVAIVVYPTLIFLALLIFPRNGLRSPKITIRPPLKLNPTRVEKSEPKAESTFVADIDRRAFIKLIGATGISFFLVSLLGRRVETAIFGNVAQPGINPTRNDNQYGLAGPSPTDGYKISEIAEGPVTYYGFIDKTGAWLIMREEADGSSFRYVKGSSDFPRSWANRENLRYDYFYNLF